MNEQARAEFAVGISAVRRYSLDKNQNHAVLTARKNRRSNIAVSTSPIQPRKKSDGEAS
jgi:hypothetical protein